VRPEAAVRAILHLSKGITMTKLQLDSAVAAALGESIDTVHRRGFSLVTAKAVGPDAGDVCLVVDCPFCRGPVPYPAAASGGAPLLAGCPHCDVEFPFELDEVYVTGDRDAAVAGHAV
jgi:hypothetical protein